MRDRSTGSLEFRKLVEPTAEIVETISRWENDPELVPFIRPSSNREALEKKVVISASDIRERLQTHQVYLVLEDGKLAGEVSYQVDPPHCHRKVTGTAWIGINIGENSARHRGIGRKAMTFVEGEIRLQGLKRIELGVFEFNESGRRLYLGLGYTEIGRIEAFTYWNGKMWQDIRMEKLL